MDHPGNQEEESPRSRHVLSVSNWQLHTGDVCLHNQELFSLQHSRDYNLYSFLPGNEQYHYIQRKLHTPLPCFLLNLFH